MVLNETYIPGQLYPTNLSELLPDPESRAIDGSKEITGIKEDMRPESKVAFHA